MLSGEVNPCGEAVAKASPNRANESLGLDPKPGDLSMSRMKLGLNQVEVRTH